MSESEVDLACLDHAYFQEEMDKLTRLLIDVKRNRFEVRNAKGTTHEWATLRQIEIQLDYLYAENEDLIQFDIKQRLDEVYTMAETLFKIKTGKLSNDFGAEGEHLLYDENCYDGYDEYNEYDDYCEDEEYYNDTPTNFYEDELAYTKRTKPYSHKRR